MTSEKWQGIIETLIAKVEHGVDFVSKEAPEVFKEIIAYRIVEEWVEMIAEAIGFMASLSCFLWACGKASQTSVEDGTIICYIILAMVSLGVECGTFACIVQSIQALVKLKLAPKFYILEVLRGML